MSVATLNLFPARIPIGRARAADVASAIAADKDINVNMSPEFERALAALFDRVGGPVAPSNTELGDMSTTSPDAAAVGVLAALLAASQRDAAIAASDAAALSAMSTQVAALKHEIATLCVLAAEVGGLRRRVADLEHQVAMGERPVDWSHPGAIGTATPASGSFTSLSATGAVNLSPANANVTVSPTGTGSITFAPATVGSMDNVILGGTAPAAATVSTLKANNASTLIGNVTIGNGASVGEFIKGANSGTAGGAFLLLQNGVSNVIGMGNKSAINGGAYDATPYITAASQIEFQQGIKVPGGAQLIQSASALTNGAGAGAGTITNAPAAGNPTKWIGINDNGTIRYVPSW